MLAFVGAHAAPRPGRHLTRGPACRLVAPARAHEPARARVLTRTLDRLECGHGGWRAQAPFAVFDGGLLALREREEEEGVGGRRAAQGRIRVSGRLEYGDGGLRARASFAVFGRGLSVVREREEDVGDSGPGAERTRALTRARVRMRAPDRLEDGDGLHVHAPFAAFDGGISAVREMEEQEGDGVPGTEMDDGGDGGGGEGGGGGGSRSGSGGGGGDGGHGGGEALPDDVSRALAAGVLSSSALARYRACASGWNPLMRLLVRVPVFRDRLLADSAFVFKLAAQELIGNGTALLSEFTERGAEITNELEYVASDLIVGTVVEAAFVWILAPCLSDATASALRAAGGGAGGAVGVGARLAEYLQKLPASAFQASTAVQQFSVSMRAAAFVYAGLQYAAIGLVAGMVGTGITYGLIEARKAADASYRPDRPMPPVWESSLGWAAFMGLLANTRFQVVEGIERVMPAVVGGRGLKTGIIGLRLANNYYGGVQFIQFFRFLGLQAVAE